jgi:hypothetical protein
VTNASWKYMWLNEGFTTYVTTRIVEKLYGAEVAEMNLQVEQEEALASLATIPRPSRRWHARSGHRSVGLRRRQPDLSERRMVPAHAGAARRPRTVRSIPARLVRPACLPVGHHRRIRGLPEEKPAGRASGIMSARPSSMNGCTHRAFQPPPSAKPRRAWRRWMQRTAWLKGELPTAELNGKNWIALEWMHFLNDIDGKATAAQMQELDQAFGLGKSGNNEIAYRFYLSSVKAGYNVREPLKNS